MYEVQNKRSIPVSIFVVEASRYECVTENYFSNFSTKTYIMLCVLKRTVSLRLFFLAAKTHV